MATPSVEASDATLAGALTEIWRRVYEFLALLSLSLGLRYIGTTSPVPPSLMSLRVRTESAIDSRPHDPGRAETDEN